VLCRSSQALSGWMGNVTAQLFSGLSRNVKSGSSPGSGWATQGHSESLVAKPLLRCRGCVLRVVVLLEWEPSPQSEVLSALEQVFTLYFAPFIFASILTSLPVPAAEKHPQSMMLPPPCFTVVMVPGFLQSWKLFLMV
jgi:hypothetical protein